MPKQDANPQEVAARAGQPVIDIVRAVYPFAYSVVADGNDASLPVWRDLLPFRVHQYASGSELNGWRVGPNWRVKKAEIRKDGALIYDGARSPLGVICQSLDFSGRVSLEELREHLFFSETLPEAIPYHWLALYRPTARNWGFCLPKRIVETLTPGDYDVEIVCENAEGTMKVLDCLLPGESEETILFNGHNCHPFQANDDMSGCAVGIAVMRKLAALPKRRFSYRLVVAPELIGTAMWLDQLGEEAATLKAGIMLKAVGNPAALKLQHSFTGEAPVDLAARLVFDRRFESYVSGAFRTIYGNDETVFEAPGYEIPTISLTRHPFPEYHTDHDTPDSLSPEALEEAADVAFDICVALENNRRMRPKFKGLVCLSHPKYDLYRQAKAANIRRDAVREEDIRWNVLMNALPRYFDGRTTLLEIAARHGVPEDELAAYIEKWREKGLVEYVD